MAFDAYKLLVQISGLRSDVLTSCLNNAEIIHSDSTISRYISNGCVHDYTVKNPVIIKLERKGVKDFDGNPDFKSKQRILLWHGTKRISIGSILENGFKVKTNNQMFEKGIYFADRLSQGANYCDDTGDHSTGYLFLCEVVVGISYVADKTHNFKTSTTIKISRGEIPCDSVLCVGERIPEPRENKYLPNLCIVPLGRTINNSAVSNCTSNFNEYVVYNPDQIKICYLVKIEFVRGRHKTCLTGARLDLDYECERSNVSQRKVINLSIILSLLHVILFTLTLE